MTAPFVPDDFDVPDGYEGSGYRLEPLGPEHNERDHAAWMSSIDHILTTPGYEGSDWPVAMTLEANLADLERHASDFTSRQGFTYSILDGDAVIGCLYIYPPQANTAGDARVQSWVTQGRAEIDALVWREVSAWLAERWPFRKPAYASRAPSAG